MKYPTVREELEKDGYSQEEKYFYELNRELIQKQRIEFDPIRKEKDLLKCPKCGSRLETTEVAGVRMDQCTGCKGAFLSSADADALIKAKKSHRLMNGLKKMFKPRDDYQLF